MHGHDDPKSRHFGHPPKQFRPDSKLIQQIFFDPDWRAWLEKVGKAPVYIRYSDSEPNLMFAGAG